MRMGFSVWARALQLALGVRAVVGGQQCGDPDAASCAVDAAGDSERASLLQTRIKAAQGLAADDCDVGDDVPCPGSGDMCAGDQCCPGINNSGNLTFPCPSANDSFAGCEMASKVASCLVPPPTTAPDVGDAAPAVDFGIDVLHIYPSGDPRHTDPQAKLTALERKQFSDKDEQFFNPHDQVFAEAKITAGAYRPTAVFLYPGAHSFDFVVPYYVSVIGLGATPGDTQVSPGTRDHQGLQVNGGGTGGLPILPAGKNGGQGGALNTFWRSVENLRIMRTINPFNWWVSQAAPIRSLIIDGDLHLSGSGFSSGGAMMNTVVGGNVNAGSQQQWYSRACKSGPQAGNRFYNRAATFGSFVCAACVQGNGNKYPTSARSTQAAATGESNTEGPAEFAEKPFVAVNSAGEFELRVPPVRSAHWGPDHDAASHQVFPFKNSGSPSEPGVFVVNERSNAASAAAINDALKSQDVVFAPGQYVINEPIKVTRAGTVLLGLGFATLHVGEDFKCPGGTAGNDNVKCSLIEVASGVSSVRIAGLLLQAGTLFDKVTAGVSSKVTPVRALLQWGEPGNHAASTHSFIYDLVARAVGTRFDCSAQSGTCFPQKPAGADMFIQINSGNVVGDNLWLWNADHCGSGIAWPCTEARVKRGLEVNGPSVAMYGLMAEHAQGDIVRWTGEDGEVVFLQIEYRYEMGPTDLPTLAPTSNVAYRVTAQNHKATGGGIYLTINHRDTQGGNTFNTADVRPLISPGGFIAIWLDHDTTYDGFSDFNAKFFWNSNNGVGTPRFWPAPDERIECKAATCVSGSNCNNEPALNSATVRCIDTTTSHL